jgi:hypothetical protein
MGPSTKQPSCYIFEPSAARYISDADDYLIIEWPDSDEESGFYPAIVRESDGLVLSEPGTSLSRAWNSKGEKVSIYDDYPRP